MSFERHTLDTCSHFSDNQINDNVIDAQIKFVLLGGEMAKRKYDPGNFKCGFWFNEDNKGQTPQSGSTLNDHGKMWMPE